MLITRKFGCKPDSGKHPRRLFREMAVASATPKGSASLFDFAPDNYDQNFCGACTGHGISMVFTTAYAVVGKPLFGLLPDGKPVACSQRDPYAGARCLDRGGRKVLLTDEGTEVLSCVTYIAQFGARKTLAPMLAVNPETGDKYTANSDCVPANVNDEPDLLELEEDFAHPVVTPHQLAGDGSRITEACLALDAGHPIVQGGWVATPFVKYTGGVLSAQDELDSNGGGHCTALLGYRTQNGKRIFRGRNSWGKNGWGLQGEGDFEADESFVMALWEMFAVVIGDAA